MAHRVQDARPQLAIVPGLGQGEGLDETALSEAAGWFSASAINGALQSARKLAFPPDKQASLLANTPYSLRHAAVSTQLNAGVSPQNVAERAGHSVEVLLQVYAGCLDGDTDWMNKLIEAVFDAG